MCEGDKTSWCAARSGCVMVCVCRPQVRFHCDVSSLHHNLVAGQCIMMAAPSVRVSQHPLKLSECGWTPQPCQTLVTSGRGGVDRLEILTWSRCQICNERLIEMFYVMWLCNKRCFYAVPCVGCCVHRDESASAVLEYFLGHIGNRFNSQLCAQWDIIMPNWKRVWLNKTKLMGSVCFEQIPCQIVKYVLNQISPTRCTDNFFVFPRNVPNRQSDKPTPTSGGVDCLAAQMQTKRSLGELVVTKKQKKKHP